MGSRLRRRPVSCRRGGGTRADATQRLVRWCDEELPRVSSWDYLGSLAPVGQAATSVIGGAIDITTTLCGAAALSLILLASTLALPAVRNFSPHPETASFARR
jgi:hypothetical protein